MPMPARDHRKLAAVLTADVVGYSRLMEADEGGTLARLKVLQSNVIFPKISEFGGRIVKTNGDGILCEFPSAVDAVQCAVDFQGAIAAQTAEEADDARLRFRVGINIGDVIVEGNDIYGDGVNIAARVEQMASPGGVWITGDVVRQVEGKLGLAFEDLGEQAVKNIARPISVYRVRFEGEDTAALYEDGDAPGRPAHIDKPSIAVLPFENLSDDASQEYFADGIAEDIITELSKSHWFFVIARNSSFSYKGEAVNVKRVARDLGVQYVLEGSVRRSGDRVRITAQLIDATTGRHAWAGRYDREIADIFAVQDEITNCIAAAVAPEMWVAETQRARRKREGNLDVWDLLMRGLWHVTQFSRADNAKGRRLLRKAIKIDPTNAQIYGQIALTHMYDALYQWSRDPRSSMEQALETAQKAVALDSGDAVAQAVLGTILLHAKRHDDALVILDRAPRLDPNLSAAHGALGSALAYSGRAAEAIEATQRALRLSPRDPFKPVWLDSLTVAAFTEGRYDDAIDIARSILRDYPNWAGAHRMVAACCGLTGRVDEARAAARQVLSLTPETTLGSVGALLAPFADPSVAQRYLDGLRTAGFPE
jgi:adenylate cyclase